MADYHPLISRAVEAMSEQSPELRRAVYDRARAALLGQLRSLDPPLSEADITRERLALDESIQRVEAEYALRDPAPAQPETPPQASPEAPLLAFPEAGPPVAPSPPRPPIPPRLPTARPPQGLAPSPFPDPSDGQALADEPLLDEPPQRPRVDTRAEGPARAGRGRTLILGSVLALVIALIGGAAFLLRDNPAELPNEPVTAEAPAAPTPAPQTDTKFSDRVAGDRPPQAPPAAPPASGPAGAPARPGEIAVAQRAALYEENAANPQEPKVTPGRAVWRLDNVNAGPGQPLETVVRASVEVPQAGLTLNMTMRRNLDQTLPASHTIELAFTTRADDAARAVRDVGLLQMKPDEMSRGVPTAGLPVPVRDNLFLIGLSNLPSDVERNVQFLTTRNWIDLPLRYASGQRAILSFEKGQGGEQALAQAFQQWR